MHSGIFVVSMYLPCLYLLPDHLYIVDASIQTLSREHIQLDLGHVQPAPMFRRIHKFKPIPEGFGYLRGERFVEGTRRVRIQVVHHQRDFRCGGIVGTNLCEKPRPHRFGAPDRYPHHPMAHQGFTGQKNRANPATPVFVIVPRWLAWRPRNGEAGLCDELFRRFVHAHHREGGVVRARIHR